MRTNEHKVFLEGNDAIVAGAMAAGAKFYAGYPISPSSEVAEGSSRELPKNGGLYVQMEDEISSMAAMLGASLAGKKAYSITQMNVRIYNGNTHIILKCTEKNGGAQER